MNRFFKFALLLTIAAVLGVPIPSFAGPLPDTGQTKCYNNTTEIPCPQPGDDFYGQDGNYLINPPSYTKLDANGNDLPDSATEWSMVRDNVTGLIWEVKTDDGSIHDKDNTYTWQNAQDIFIAALNDAAFGGHSDWRLPSLQELTTIIHYQKQSPSIDATYFPHTKASQFWVATIVVFEYPGPPPAWGVDFSKGQVLPNLSNQSYVRAVRGKPIRTVGRFYTNEDSTVTDTVTGLMWQQSTGRQGVWAEAVRYCKELILAGFSDWRVPSIRELLSIVDYERFRPCVDTSFFPDTASCLYWSGTSEQEYASFGWHVDFDRGSDYARDKSDNIYYLRAVRGGQTHAIGHLFILTPSQGSAWNLGESMPISWETQGFGGDVKISLSRQGGKDGSFVTIEERTENDGAYNWTVSEPVSFNCVLKIEPLEDISRGTSQGLFTIYVYGAPTATTTSASSVGPETHHPQRYSQSEWGVHDGSL